MASVSSTGGSSGLGNTALMGFGGLASGIDRDAMIEQLTKSTQSKLTKANQTTTKLEWKQEAIQNIADKIIGLHDDYLSFTGSSSVKSAALFESSVLTPEGSESATRYIKASGASDMSRHLNIRAVTKTASSASVVSSVKGDLGAITTGLTAELLSKQDAAVSSKLSGMKLEFGQYNFTDKKFNVLSTFTFPSSYKDADGTVHTLDYVSEGTEAKKKLVGELNNYLKTSGETSLGEDGEKLSFAYDEANDAISIVGNSAYSIKPNQPVLKALGYNGESSDYIRVEDFNSSVLASAQSGQGFSVSSVDKKSMLDLLTDAELSVSYNGVKKTVKLISAEERAGLPDSASGEEKLNYIKDSLKKHIDEAFGSGKINVSINQEGRLELENASSADKSSLSISSSNNSLLKNLGISDGASNKINMSGSLWENREKLFGESFGTEEELNAALSELKINGTKIDGITASSSVNTLLSKINSSKAGVKASFMEGSGRFVLIAEESGSGRDIRLGDGSGSSAAELIFGGAGSISQDGSDAELIYDYGNGVTETAKSSSNTFNIDGMSITVSGTFGVQKNAEGSMLTEADGSYKLDSSQSVRFTSSANVEKATETVKKFIESYNEIVTLVNDQVRTRPASGYDPLTDKQKEEMSDKSIENWEKKAKEGLLYNESSVRNLSNSLQTVMTGMMQQLSKLGLEYKDMQDIGISMSDDYNDGGRLSFDESKFKAAMENQPEKVSKIISGTADEKGLAAIVEDTLTRYATRYSSRNKGSYGELVVAGGSSKLSLSKQKNEIYTALKENEEKIARLKELLKTEQNRYIKQFSAMETAISNMNAQASYLSNLTG